MFRFYSTEFSTHNAQLLIHGWTLSIMLRATTLSEHIFSGSCSTNKAGLTQESVMTSVIGHKVGDRVDLRGGWKIKKILTNLLNPQSFTLYYEQLYYVPNHQVMLAISCQKFSGLHIYQWCFPLFLCAVFQKHALLPYLINHLFWYNSLIYLLWNQPFSLPLPCSLSSRKLILSLEWFFFSVWRQSKVSFKILLDFSLHSSAWVPHLVKNQLVQGPPVNLLHLYFSSLLY